MRAFANIMYCVAYMVVMLKHTTCTRFIQTILIYFPIDFLSNKPPNDQISCLSLNPISCSLFRSDYEGCWEVLSIVSLDVLRPFILTTHRAPIRTILSRVVKPSNHNPLNPKFVANCDRALKCNRQAPTPRFITRARVGRFSTHFIFCNSNPVYCIHCHLPSSTTA